MPAVIWFKDLRKEDVPIAGGKGANLGEMTSAGFPVPPGFVITAQTYKNFIESADIKEDIDDLLKNLNVNDTEQLNAASRAIETMIRSAKISEQVSNEIIEAYNKLSEGSIVIAGSEAEVGEFVAVRSSATAEDLPGASFAGQQKTLLNVKGKTELINAVKECWASLFEPRAIFYRKEKGFDSDKVLISVIVQKMVDSDKSGVMFTVDPVTNDRNKISIDAAWGLGEAVVSGQVTPDHYSVDKNSLVVLSKSVSEKTFMYTRDIETGKTKKVTLSEETARKQVLTDDEIKKLAEFGKKIEEHYNFPQDIEWAIEDSEIFIVQSRPITTLKETKEIPEDVEDVIGNDNARTLESPSVSEKVSEESPKIEKEPIVKGLEASPGVGIGKVKLVKDASEISKVEKGDVLVTQMTSPDFVPAMERAVAIVTDEGGITSHAAIVSRELGVPCIVGTENATSVLSEGQVVTVDANKGVVYDGAIESLTQKETKPQEGSAIATGPIITATKIYVNLGIPSRAAEIAKLPVDGVGLMREEFIFASLIGEHPLAMIERGEEQKFIDILADGIETVAKAFSPRQVVLRLSDFKTNEYRTLKGGEKFEQEEANPMLGWRGCSRYTSKKYEPAFRLELRAVKKVRDNGYKNIVVMLPFVRTLEDVKKVTQLMKEEGLERGPDLKLWMMAEVPSNILLADEFAKLVDGFSIGSNDLTQLIMGADRDSEILAKLGYFDEGNPAVKRAISQLIKVAHENGCTVSICGQRPSNDPDFARFLVEHGIDSISVNADVAIKTRRIVAAEERKLLLEKLREDQIPGEVKPQ